MCWKNPTDIFALFLFLFNMYIYWWCWSCLFCLIKIAIAMEWTWKDAFVGATPPTLVPLSYLYGNLFYACAHGVSSYHLPLPTSLPPDIPPSRHPSLSPSPQKAVEIITMILGSLWDSCLFSLLTAECLEVARCYSRGDSTLLVPPISLFPLLFFYYYQFYSSSPSHLSFFFFSPSCSFITINSTPSSPHLPLTFSPSPFVYFIFPGRLHPRSTSNLWKSPKMSLYVSKRYRSSQFGRDLWKTD